MNKVFATVMRLGIMKDGPVVLTVPGRKSGKPRSTPITLFTVDGKRYVVGGFPGADWVRNARAADVATLTQGRSAEPVHMVELPADEARPLLRAFPTLVPTGVGFMKNAGLVTEGRPTNSRRWPGGAPCSDSSRPDDPPPDRRDTRRGAAELLPGGARRPVLHRRGATPGSASKPFDGGTVWISPDGLVGVTTGGAPTGSGAQRGPHAAAGDGDGRPGRRLPAADREQRPGGPPLRARRLQDLHRVRRAGRAVRVRPAEPARQRHRRRLRRPG